MASTLLNRYLVRSEIGRGALATVWLATDKILNRTVAVKILHPRLSADDSFRERFQQEALAAAKLVHPHILSIYDTGEAEDVLFVVMELARTNLRAMLDAGLIHSGGAEEIARLGADVCSALAYAHSQGAIHSDIKPSNILFSEGPGTYATKLGDFGLGRSTAQVATTEATSGMTTLEYQSPEQISGQPLDARSDIYSLGCVLYEAASGTVPFPGDDFTTAAVTETAPRPLKQRALATSPALSQAVMRALERDPAARFSDADEMRRALLDVIEASGPRYARPAQDRTSVVPKAPGKPVSFVRSEGRWLAIAVAVIVTAGAIVFGVVRYGEQLVSSVRESLSGPALPSGAEIPIKAVSAYDPRGDEDSNTEEPPNVADRDPATTWQTQHYRSSDFGRLKEGVGLLLDLGEAREVSRIRVVTPTPGLKASVRHSEDGKEWSLPGPSASVGGEHEFTVKGKYRYWMIWITELPETEGESNNPFSASIAEIQAYAG